MTCDFRHSQSSGQSITKRNRRMLKMFIARLKEGHPYHQITRGAPPILPDRFRCRPVIDVSKCPADCNVCAEAFPTGAIDPANKTCIDLGKCLFCTDCINCSARKGCINLGRLSTRRLQPTGFVHEGQQQSLALPKRWRAELKKLYGRSLKLRQVSAGGCNACEADTNVLNTLGGGIGTVRNPVCRLSTSRRRPADHRAGHPKYAHWP
jgi:hypothetical protein